MANKSIFPVLINQRISPYRLSTQDFIQSKVEVYYKGRLLNVSDLRLELWFNYTGEWSRKVTSSTNRFGVQTMLHSCANIKDIDFCLGYCKVFYDGVEYTSNVVRYNFIVTPYINLNAVEIDAGTCETQITPLDRSTYDTFDSGSGVVNRDDFNQYDRFGGL
jgi:hypothetical protein